MRTPFCGARQPQHSPATRGLVGSVTAAPHAQGFYAASGERTTRRIVGSGPVNEKPLLPGILRSSFSSTTACAATQNAPYQEEVMSHETNGTLVERTYISQAGWTSKSCVPYQSAERMKVSRTEHSSPPSPR